MYKYLLILSLILATICFSCGDQTLDEITTSIGSEYLEKDAGIMMIDTFSVELSTVILDSVNTSGSGVALVGSFYDEDFGQIHSDAIFRVSSPGSIKIEDDDVYDSICLCIKYNDYYLGDTIQAHSFTVEEIDSDLEQMKKDRRLGDSDEDFYNTTIVSSKRVLGEYTARPKVTNSDTIFIPLDKDFGLELFQMLDDKDEDITDASKFLDYFHGIILRGNRELNKSVIGFNVSDSCSMKIYYHQTLSEKVYKEIEFDIESSSNYQYNSIDIDRTDTNLPLNTSQKEKILSSDTDDKCFLQGGTGMYVKIEFPGLASVETLPALNQIIKAEIVFVPIEEDYNDFPSYLTVYESDTRNNVGDVILAINESDYSYMYLYENEDDEDDEEYYKVDITNQFVDEFLDNVYDDDFSFLIGLSPTNMISSLTSVKIAGEGIKDGDYKPKLRLYTYYY